MEETSIQSTRHEGGLGSVSDPEQWPELVTRDRMQAEQQLELARGQRPAFLLKAHGNHR